MRLKDQEQVFAGWLREHAGILHHVARAFAVGADRHDLMQELLLTLWRAAPKFRGDARESTFIYRVAHNTALAWLRRHRKSSAGIEALDPVIADNLPASDVPSEDERLGLLYVAIRELPALDRSLVLLHLDDRPHQEIAEIHGISINNVAVRLNRIRRKLTERLQGESDDLR
jgi:RNA polymerase sigma factor (sigma-70 family)